MRTAIIFVLIISGCGDESTLTTHEKNMGLTLSTAVPIADPYRQTYPKDDANDNYARSIWDMQAYDGRVYIGSGDLVYNRGPVQVWSFTESGGAVDFQKEILVDEEEVARFRVSGGKLLIPGLDSKESWDWGNFYYKENGAWTKKRTVPNGLHVWDVAVLGDELFASVTTQAGYSTLRSKDFGNTWSVLGPPPAATGIMASVDDKLFIFTWMKLYVLQGGQVSDFQRIHANPDRTESFKGGALYANSSICPLSPLYYLPNPAAIEQKIHFGPSSVVDVIVNGNTVYVLTAEQKQGRKQYAGRIFSSSDLANWNKEAEFAVSAMPLSFEMLNGTFYVGLGSDSFLFANADSGLIVKIQ